GHRVVVRAITDQRQRTDSRGDLLAGLVWSRRQRQQRCTIALEALADGLGVSAQPPLTPPAALLFQVRVQLFPTRHAWNRDHEVPPCVTDQAFDLALVVAPGRAAELIGEQVVTLQLGEGPRPLPFL